MWQRPSASGSARPRDRGGRRVGIASCRHPATAFSGRIRSGGNTCMQVGPRNRFPWSWHPRIHRRMHSRMHRRMHPGTPSWVVQPGIGFERLILSRAAVRPARDKINLSKRLAAGTRFSTPTHTHTHTARTPPVPAPPSESRTHPARRLATRPHNGPLRRHHHPPARYRRRPAGVEIHKRLGWVVGRSVDVCMGRCMDGVGGWLGALMDCWMDA